MKRSRTLCAGRLCAGKRVNKACERWNNIQGDSLVQERIHGINEEFEFGLFAGQLHPALVSYLQG